LPWSTELLIGSRAHLDLPRNWRQPQAISFASLLPPTVRIEGRYAAQPGRTDRVDGSCQFLLLQENMGEFTSSRRRPS